MTTIDFYSLYKAYKLGDKTLEWIIDKLSPDQRTNMEKAISSIYNTTVKRFEQIYPYEQTVFDKLKKQGKKPKDDLIRSSRQQFPFYEAQKFQQLVIINKFLLAHLYSDLSKEDLTQKIIDAISEEKNILYTKESIQEFLSLFEQNIIADADLFVYLLPFRVQTLDEKIDKILELLNNQQKINDLKEQLLSTESQRRQVLLYNNITIDGNNNIVLQNVIAGRDIIINQNISNISLKPFPNEDKDIKELEIYIPREEYERELEEILKQHSFVIISGVAGIGKSYLAYNYEKQHKADFEVIHNFYLSENSKIEQVLIDYFFQFQEFAELKDLTDKEKIHNVIATGIRVLANKGKRFLLVFHNVDTNEQIKSLKEFINQKLSGIENLTLIITTRVLSKGIKLAKGFTEDQAFALFKKMMNKAPQDIHKELLKKLGYHPLLIKLILSRLLYAEEFPEYQISEEEFIRKKITELDELEIDIERHTDFAELETTIADYVRELIDFSIFNRLEQEILALLASLEPMQNIARETLSNLFGFFEQKVLDKSLIKLAKLNYVEREVVDEEVFYRMYRLVIDVAIEKIANKISEQHIWDVIDNFMDLFFFDNFKSPVEVFSFLPLADNFLKNTIGGVENTDQLIKVYSDDKLKQIAIFFNKISTIYKAQGDFDKAMEYALKAKEIGEKVLAADHPLLATSYNTIATIYYQKGELDNALEYALKAKAISEKVLSEDHPSLATSYNNISLIYQDRGDLERALEYALKAKEIWEKVLPEDHPLLATSYNNIAMIYKDQGDLERALEYTLKAEVINEKVLPEDHPLLATSYNNIAGIYKGRGDLEQAMEYALKAKAIFEKVLPKKHPSLATSYNNIALIYLGRGNLDRSLEYALKAKEIREKVLPEDHPDLAASYNNIALIYQAKGDLDKALEYAFKAKEISEKVLPEDHPLLATSYNNLSLVYKEQGDLDKAVEYALKDLEIREKVLLKDHPSLATSYNNIAEIYRNKDDLDKALEYALKAKAIFEKVLSEDHPDLATLYNNISLIYYQKGDLEKSLDYALKAKAISEKALPDDHPDLATSYNNIAMIYQDQGELYKAMDYALKAKEIFEKVLPPEHPSLAISYGNIAFIYYKKGEKQKAYDYITKAVEIFEKKLPPNHPHVRITKEFKKRLEKELNI